MCDKASNIDSSDIRKIKIDPSCLELCDIASLSTDFDLWFYRIEREHEYVRIGESGHRTLVEHDSWLCDWRDCLAK